MVPNTEPPIVPVTSANGCSQKRRASLQQNLREGGPSSPRSLLQLDVASAASRFPPPGRSAALALALVRLSFAPQINKNARISVFFPSLQSGFLSGLCKLTDTGAGCVSHL